jgi:hypothetical protein
MCETCVNHAGAGIISEAPQRKETYLEGLLKRRSELMDELSLLNETVSVMETYPQVQQLFEALKEHENRQRRGY